MFVEGIGLVRRLILLHGPRSWRCSTLHTPIHAAALHQAPVTLGVGCGLLPSHAFSLLWPTPITGTETLSSTAYTFTTTTAVATTSAQPTPRAQNQQTSQTFSHRLLRDFPFLRATVLAAFQGSLAIPARPSNTSSCTTSSTRCWTPASRAHSAPSQPSPSTRNSTPTEASSRTFPVWRRAVPG